MDMLESEICQVVRGRRAEGLLAHVMRVPISSFPAISEPHQLNCQLGITIRLGYRMMLYVC
jgi:hypothetical protein